MKLIKILAQLALVRYDDEEDVEWIYDTNIETDEIFVDPPITPIWEES